MKTFYVTGQLAMYPTTLSATNEAHFVKIKAKYPDEAVDVYKQDNDVSVDGVGVYQHDELHDQFVLTEHFPSEYKVLMGWAEFWESKAEEARGQADLYWNKVKQCRQKMRELNGATQ